MYLSLNKTVPLLFRIHLCGMNPGSSLYAYVFYNVSELTISQNTHIIPAHKYRQLLQSGNWEYLFLLSGQNQHFAP